MGSVSDSLSQIISGLRQPENRGKSIPFHLLYDDRGSELYKDITNLDTYYLFNAEKSLLHSHAPHIARNISPDTLIVELGCGVADKTAILLDAVQKAHQRSCYVGIDVSQTSLDEAEQTIGRVNASVEFQLIRADFLEGLRLVRSKYPDKLICLVWLGSGMGNLNKSECVGFTRELLKLVGSRCQFFLCVDIWKDESVLRAAYDDPKGVTASFIKNGMRNGLEHLGHAVSETELEAWKYEVEVCSKSRRVKMFVRFPEKLSLPDYGIEIRENERVLVEFSRKFNDEDVLQLCSQVGLVQDAKWSSKEYACYMLLSSEEALLRCWRDTDYLFQGVEDWLSKPIPYRHPFCFYYGHVAAFERLKLLKSTSDFTITSDFTSLFSRGMDPLMLDPSKCHRHPPTPPQWPDKHSLVKYVTEARGELLNHLNLISLDMRRLNLVLEHERMHQETVCYMLAQQRKLNVSSSSSGSFNECVVRSSSRKPMIVNKPDVRIPAGTVVLGCNPLPGVFRLDNEQPAAVREVEQDFWVSSLPVSVSEFMLFVTEGGYSREEFWQPEDFEFLQRNKQLFPATWSCSSEGQFMVHTHESTAEWTDVAHQAVFVSLMEAEAFCRWMGWRVMSEAEYERVLKAEKGGVKQLREGGWEWTSSALEAFEGFEPMVEYPEYSVDFFDGLHYVLKGSSPVTHVSLLRDSFRNFYQRQYPYVFAKFRGCKSTL